MSAASKSLFTNVVISGVFFILISVVYFSSDDVTAVLCILSKTLFSMTTITVNFGPIKTQVESLVNDFFLQFIHR